MTPIARQVETARPREKDYKLSDECGLYLLVKITGARYWRLKYRIAGKEKKLALGVYPDVSLVEVRIKRDGARKIISEGGDPGEKKRKEKLTQKVSTTNTFHALVTEWYQHKSLSWSGSHARNVLEALDRDIFPYLGKRSVTDILPLEMLEILRYIEKRGSPEKPRKVCRHYNQISRYAIATGRATVNPASELTSTLAAPKAVRLPHLRVDELPIFLRKLAEYHDSLVTRMATNLPLLIGLRTIELRSAEWPEIDLDNVLRTIPENCMKMQRKHVVPLSRQAIDILPQLKTFSGQYRLVFPGRCDINKPMNEASINMALERIGYDSRATGHGFRHTMSTTLYEQGSNSAWIEMQLIHVDKNAARGTYNRTQYLDGCREMMQWYADYIDSLSG